MTSSLAIACTPGTSREPHILSASPPQLFLPVCTFLFDAGERYPGGSSQCSCHSSTMYTRPKAFRNIKFVRFDGNPKMRKTPLKQFGHHTPNNLSHRSMQQFHQNSTVFFTT